MRDLTVMVKSSKERKKDRRKHRKTSYYKGGLSAYVLGVVCRIVDSCVARNHLRSSCMLDFLAVFVLLVPCINRDLGHFRIFRRSLPRRGLVVERRDLISPSQDSSVVSKSPG